MNDDTAQLNKKTMMDLLIRMTLILYLSYLCLKVFAPFALLMLWALIIAIVLFPLHQKLAKKFNGKQGRAATVIVLLGCLIIGTPVVVLGFSLVDHIQDVYRAYESGNVQIQEPKESVKEWPIIGLKAHKLWTEASADFSAFLVDYKEPITSFFKKMLAAAGGAMGSVAMFMGALVISGFMMAFGEKGSAVMLKIANRITGVQRGEKLTKLSVMTVRSVTTGVIGVAFIQALIIGIGLILADIPAAAILSLVVMFLGILQLPAIIVILPVIIYMWTSTGSSLAANIFFTIYFIVGGLSDNVLKPLLLGRGVDAPMPIVLIGALGGMMASGLIGLFLGATLLAVAYRIFMDWVDAPEGDQQINAE